MDEGGFEGRAVAMGASPPRETTFRFTGTGGEYFRIWIVNLVLTLLTVGLYSPWAKVRRLRWFHGHTVVAGSSFDFHGNPLALLKGRLVAVALLVAYTQADKVSLALWFAVALAILLLLPWLLVQSLRFRLANTSYRGIRAGFDGSVGAGYLAFVPLMVLVLGPAIAIHLMRVESATSGPTSPAKLFTTLVPAVILCLTPWFMRNWRAYQIRHARLGAARFAFDGSTRGAYWVAARLFGLNLLMLFASVLGALLLGGLAWFVARSAGERVAATVGAGVGIAFVYLALISMTAVARGLIQNFVWNATALDGHRFESRLKVSRLWRIEAANIVLTLVTLGLYWPHAVVRSRRCRIEALSWTGDPDALSASARSGHAATGEEAADLFGLELGL